MGQDAYFDLFTKAAALLHSVANNHALVDGNKRLGWLATAVFLGINGFEIGLFAFQGWMVGRRVQSGLPA